ncbi:MAG: peptidylprolyl isomerase [Elusimicrobiota bacterium]
MIKKMFILALSLSVSMLILTGCGKGKIVAKIGCSKITKNEFNEKINALPDYYGDFFKTERGKKEFLDSMVREYIVAEAGRKSKLNKDKDFKKEMKDFENQLLITKMITKLKEKDLAVGEEDVKAYYDENKAYYDNPYRVKVSHILVNTKKEADELVSDLAAGRDFADLAKENSIDNATAYKGGDIGFFMKGELAPDFETAAFSLKNIGDVSAPVETKFGYHLIKLTNLEQMKPLTLADVSDNLGATLERNKFDNWLEKQKKKLKVKVKYAVLNREEKSKEKKEAEVTENEK